MADFRQDYEVVVIGAGPGGMAAASVAAEAGRSVALIDNTAGPGGQIWRSRKPEDMPPAAQEWLARLNGSGAECIYETTAFAPGDSGSILAEQSDGVVEIGYQKLILAVGAQELFMPFPGWTLPNVMGVGGLQVLSKAGWPVEGKRVVVAGSGPLLLAAAAHLKKYGAKIVCMAEQARLGKLVNFGAQLPFLAPGKLIQGAGFQWDLLGVPYRTNCWPVAAEGDECLKSVQLTNGKSAWTEECDYLACAFGLSPSLQWPRLLGCRTEAGNVVLDQTQQTTVSGVFCVAADAMVGGVDSSLVEGQIAGYAAAGQSSAAERLFFARRKTKKFAEAMENAFSLRDELKNLATDDTIVCRCEDVTLGEIKEHDNLRSAKLQTRCGMGPCQGRICHCALQTIHGWQSDSPRPPVLPTRVESLAGRSSDD